jgi:uncharacterized sulfatase
VDTTLVKDFLLKHQNDPAHAKQFLLIFAKRPPEELYDLRSDPHQIVNVVDKPGYANALQVHRDRLDGWMRQTGDPRIDASNDDWEKFPYYGKAIRRE